MNIWSCQSRVTRAMRAGERQTDRRLHNRLGLRDSLSLFPSTTVCRRFNHHNSPSPFPESRAQKNQYDRRRCLAHAASSVHSPGFLAYGASSCSRSRSRSTKAAAATIARSLARSLTFYDTTSHTRHAPSFSDRRHDARASTEWRSVRRGSRAPWPRWLHGRRQYSI